MKVFRFLILVIVPIMLLSACYNTEGKTKSSEIAGFESYSNKTINASVLTPMGWDGQVSMDGEYVLTSPAADKVQIIISSADITRLMGNASSVNFEDYVNFRASQVTEKTIGPDFNLRKSKSKLAGLDAYEFLYSYLPQGNKQKQMVNEVFTLVGGKVYKFYYYANETIYSEYLNKAMTVKDSYKILK